MPETSEKVEFDIHFSPAYREMLQAKIDDHTHVDITELMWMVWCHARPVAADNNEDSNND